MRRLTPGDLVEIAAIERLKYRYIRALDLKEWDALGDCLTEDCRSAYGDGRFSFEGRAAIVTFLKDALGPPTRISSHRVHHPEIDLTGPTAATGLWALDDVVIETEARLTIRGSAYYHDEYVKVGGAWKIARTGYRRIYEETESRSDTPSLVLTTHASVHAG
ncbi:MAG: nuclear transport factor 2 family protein [Deltaproteobacteria bacterium]|nr:nuclear transport factor 2 family protein [Deltaproteobacteria bacterium]